MYKMSNPPANLGKKWSDEEVQRLLQAVRKKETIEQIAQTHERTPGGIRARLKGLAADYYFNDNRPMEEIIKFTGLDLETITDAIAKRQWELDQKEKQPIKVVLKSPTPEPKKEDMIPLLTEIRDLMKEMVELMKKD